MFISNSSRDAALAHELAAALESAGMPCWISGRDIAPGANAREAILAAILRGRAMVLLVPESANAKNEVKQELSLISTQGITIYLVRLGVARTNAASRYQLATRQWIEGGDAPALVATLAVARGIEPANCVSGSTH
ncbi:MAG: toll/interleukin-1 receptor domain-containing protein [Acetobacteraceae bacterium]|nr:toll/interleukin-1 receptor domain-containing protein [Acetobacteraceae bacterium]